MSQRYGREDQERRESGERRGEANPRTDTEGRGNDDLRGGNVPRRVGKLRDGHAEQSSGGAHRRDREDSHRDADTHRGTSWLSVILGWLAALGAGLILSGIVGAIVGAILGGASSSATEGGTAGLIGLLITLLLAFIVGGYVAGRLASRSGLKHGLLVPVLMLVVTVLLAGVGTLLGLSFLDNLGGVTLPNAPSDAPQNLSTILTGAGILALLMPFVGGAIGGALGVRTGRRRP